jgi:hypothetical protein
VTKIKSIDEADLRARVARGETSAQIALAYGCSEKVAHRYVRIFGLSTKDNYHKTRRPPSETEEKIKALWLAGTSGTEIGRQMGMTRNAVISMANRRGWVRPAEVARQNSKVEARRARGPATPRAARVGIAGNGMTFERAPGAALPRLRVVEATGEVARICDSHFNRFGCKWPIGTPPAGFADEQTFCNGTQAPGDGRYCSAHAALARNPNQPKRPASPPPLGGGQAYRYGERKYAR